MPRVGHPSRGAARYGPRWAVALRCGVSAVIAAPLAVLALSLLMWTSEDDPRPAAMVFFLLGLATMFAVPLLYGVWRPTGAWRREQAEALTLQLRLKDNLARSARHQEPAPSDAKPSRSR
jgi:hypothetical protein